MSSVNVTWLGHASFMVNAGDKVIYLDPYAGEYAEKAHLIMISHSHSDHCDSTKIQAIRQRDTIVLAPSDCRSKIGGSMKSLKPGEKAVVDDIVVEAVPAYNHKRFRSPGIPYHPKDLGVGYLLTAEGKTIYHAGDTDFIEEMNALKARNIDLALLPSGGTYTMDNPDAVEATLAINPTFVIPMHRWDTSPADFKRGVEDRSHITVVLLKPGEPFTLP
ncbi:MAG: MBL fold metallo-hydrolase [Candidatus Bathyarchaeota archaeon]|nr:MBL fold metallo-hydrolase [Candidatus Bathyarchaeota archaeon]